MGLPVVRGSEIGLHLFLPPGEATAALSGLRALGRSAAAAGFDLVSVGEHHGGTAGYLPTPWLFLASLLTERPELRGGAYPLLAGMREPAMLVEEAELACASFAGRLQVAVGVGYLEDDFRVCGTDPADARRRFEEVLARMRARAEQGSALCDAVLVAGGGPRSRATALAEGAGLLLPPLPEAEEARTVEEFRAAGGLGRVVVQRWLAVGPADTQVYSGLKAPWEPAALAPSSVAERADILGRALELTGAGGVSVRIGGPLTDPVAVSAEIERAGEALASLAPEPVEPGPIEVVT